MIKWAKKVHLKIKYQQESLVWIKALKKMTCLKQYVCLLLIAHPVTFLGKLELVPFLWLGAASRLILVSVSSYWVLLGETLPRSPVKVRQGSSEHFLLLSGKYAPAEGRNSNRSFFLSLHESFLLAQRDFYLLWTPKFWSFKSYIWQFILWSHGSQIVIPSRYLNFQLCTFLCTNFYT